MSHKKFHLGYFTKFGATAWPSEPDAFGAQWADGTFHRELATLLEAAKFDFLLFEDSVTVAETYGSSLQYDLKHAVYAPKNDPLPLLPLLASDTSHIGFIATASTTFYPPYLLARAFSTIDSLTAGRVGWNIVTSSEDSAAQNFGMEKLPPVSERYTRADEYVELAGALWDSWEDGAVVADLESGVHVDHAKVHHVNFEGEFYKSRGPLNSVRSPQGRPVFSQAGASDRGRDFAAKNAEVIVGMMSGGVAGMRAFREDIRARMKKFNRDPDECRIFFLAPVTIVAEDPADQPAPTATQAQTLDEYGMVMASVTMGIDLSRYDLDAPVDQNLEGTGHTSIVDHLKELGRQGMTLREAMSQGYGGDEVNFIGTPAQIAEQMISVMDQVGGDGFLIEGAHFTPYVRQFAEQIIPLLQDAGVVRTEYTGKTLREVLNEF